MSADTEATLVPVESGLLATLAGAEIDKQIATAHRYPRDLTKFHANSIALACPDEETASSMFYVLERTDRDGKKVAIEGPSIRLAEIVAMTFGNLRCEARVVDIGERFLRAAGTVHDLENNVAWRAEVTRAIWGRRGRFSENMIQQIANAANSIALRNAMFRAVPFSFVKPIYDRARQKAIGSGPIQVRWQKAVDFAGKFGATEVDLRTLISKTSPADVIQDDDLLKLRGILTAIKDHETTLEEALATARGAVEVDQPADLGEGPNAAAKGKAKLEAVAEKLKAQANPTPDPNVGIRAELDAAWSAVVAAESTLFTNPDEAEAMRKSVLGQSTREGVTLDTVKAYLVALENRAAKDKGKAK